MGWLAYLLYFDRRPRIPQHLVNPFNEAEVSEDDLLILMAGKSRDMEYIERLMKKYNATSRLDLLKKLPKRKRTPLRRRFKSLIARWEGSLPYDPMRREMHFIREKERQSSRYGIRKTRLH